MIKKFNPDRDPYDQVLAHSGEVLMLIRGRSGAYRFRAVKGKECLYSLFYYNKYATDCDIKIQMDVVMRRAIKDRSCFSRKATSKKNLLKRMRKYDKKTRKVEFIWFM